MKTANINNQIIIERHYFERIILLYSLIFGVVMQLSFSLWNYYNGLTSESIFDLSSSILFLVSIYLYVKQNRKFAVQATMSTITYICTYSIYIHPTSSEAFALGFYVIPFVAFYFMNYKDGIIWNIILLVPIFFMFFINIGINETLFSSDYILRFSISIIILSFIAGFFKLLRKRSWDQLLSINKKLKKSTEHLKILEGFVPICSYCKKIKNDDGFWSELKEYLKANTDAQISSSICGSCLKKLNIRNDTLKEKTILPTENNIVKESKRWFVMVTGIISIGIILSFAVVDFLHDDIFDSIFRMALCFVFLTTTILLKKRIILICAFFLNVIALIFLFVQPFLFSTPDKPEILWFFLLPFFANHLLSAKKSLIIMSILLIFTGMVFSEFSLFSLVHYTLEFKSFFILIFILIYSLSFFMDQVITKYSIALENNMILLQTNYDSIKTVKGLVPVCAVCHSIQNEKGFWTKLETYISDNSAIKLSHGICDDCFKIEFPDIYEKRELKRKNNS